MVSLLYAFPIILCAKKPLGASAMPRLDWGCGQAKFLPVKHAVPVACGPSDQLARHLSAAASCCSACMLNPCARNHMHWQLDTPRADFGPYPDTHTLRIPKIYHHGELSTLPEGVWQTKI